MSEKHNIDDVAAEKRDAAAGGATGGAVKAATRDEMAARGEGRGLDLETESHLEQVMRWFEEDEVDYDLE